MILRAQIQDENSPWHVLDGKVNVRSVAFCGPMTTVLLDNASEETDKFVQEIADNSVNFIYKNDVVPRYEMLLILQSLLFFYSCLTQHFCRGYGYLTFVEGKLYAVFANILHATELLTLTSNNSHQRLGRECCSFSFKTKGSKISQSCV